MNLVIVNGLAKGIDTAHMAALQNGENYCSDWNRTGCVFILKPNKRLQDYSAMIIWFSVVRYQANNL